MCRRFIKFALTKKGFLDLAKTVNLSSIEVNIIYKGAIKCEKFIGYTKSENNLLYWTDVETWKYSYRAGLETLVVYTANDEYLTEKFKLTRKYSTWEVQLQYWNLTELAGI
jgi:hypothetical protein